jgi:PAS domain S-box-containing protein
MTPVTVFLIAVPAMIAGAVTALLATSRRRRQTERQQRAADAHLKAVIDHSSAAIYLKDRNHRFLMVNRRHMDLWPNKREFSPGMSAFDIFPAQIAQWFTESDAPVLQEGREYTFEEDLRFAGGVRTYVSSKFPVRDEVGNIIAIGGVSTDITDLKHAQADIARKEQLLRRLIDVQESEKQQLCHEFHDGLIQYAYGSKMLLESLDLALLPEKAATTINAVIEYLARGIEDGRRTIRGIRPAALDDLGLVSALVELCEQVQQNGLEVDAEIFPTLDSVPKDLQTTVYRIVQESLSNAVRHSGADQVRVRVRRDSTAVEIMISDTGQGFEPEACSPTGFGLVGMGERVRLAGGEFSIWSEPGQGARVTARLPFCADEKVGDEEVRGRLMAPHAG